MRTFLIFLFFIATNIALSQNSLSLKIIDAESKKEIPGAKVKFKGLRLGAISDTLGQVNFPNVPPGEQEFEVSFLGYHSKVLSRTFPLEENTLIIVKLEREDEELDAIIVEATRSNRTIQNLPTRTEVLTEEIDEAASMEPSKIAHLITHSTGIQVQTTSASSNGAVVRIQGLQGRYTQMLKDGFPLYGGFSGSLDVLQIPPLDLRQVEFVKGPASTLYGGGAIGGLVNLLSKDPNKEETLLHINMSHIGARDMNFFASRRFGKFGFTNLASIHMHKAYDPDDNGYTDVPEVLKFNFNPRLFYYPSEKTEFYLGFMYTKENRQGGDMSLINNGEITLNDFYYDRQNTERITSQFRFRQKLEKGNLELKNSVSSYDRFIDVREDIFGTESKFSGNQFNSFSELRYQFINEKNNLNLGFNVYTDRFEEDQLDTNELRNQQFFTYGLFANHLIDFNEKLSMESGFRLDYALASSQAGSLYGAIFPLPRWSLLWKPFKKFSIRGGGGLGYRLPSVFSEEAEPLAYRNVHKIDFSNTEAERSYGTNIDFKFTSDFGSENVLLTLNQMFYYNWIDSPILLNINGMGHFEYANSPGWLHSRGFETQMKMTLWWFTWFVGYTYTESFILDGGLESDLILTPQHSIKGDLLFVVEDKWRIGWDYEYKSRQLLSTGLYSPDIFTTGVIVERTLNNFVIFLNAENFTDVRQSKYESTLQGPNNTPQFIDVWAPLDGFFFNAGLKIKL